MKPDRQKQVVAIALLCTGIAFSVLAATASPNRTLFALVACANLCASAVFFLQLRAAKRQDSDS